MKKNKIKGLTFRQKQLKNKNSMYAEYLNSINENPNINKSELKRNLASKYGYTSENSVNTIIWEIEKNNGRKSKKIENEN